jgi:hypothetical protein
VKVADFYVQKRLGWVQLHEKGGKIADFGGLLHPRQLRLAWG